MLQDILLDVYGFNPSRSKPMWRHLMFFAYFDLRLYELLLLYIQHTLLDEAAIVELSDGEFRLVLGESSQRGAGGAPTGKSRKSKPQRGGGVSGGAHSLATRRAAEESNNLYSSRVDMMFSKISKMATA